MGPGGYQRMSAVLGKPSGPVIAIAGPTASGKSVAAVALAARIRRRRHQCRCHAGLSRPGGADRAPGGCGDGASRRTAFTAFSRLPSAATPGAGAPWRWPRSPPRKRPASCRSWSAAPAFTWRRSARAWHRSRAIPDEIRAEAARAPRAARRRSVFTPSWRGSIPRWRRASTPGDTQRLLRAWEVSAATGESLAAFQRRTPDEPTGAASTTLLLMPPREALYAACDARCRRMMEQGALAEAAGAAGARAARRPAGDEIGRRAGAGRHLARYEPTLRYGAIPVPAGDAATMPSARCTWFRHRLPGSPGLG